MVTLGPSCKIGMAQTQFLRRLFAYFAQQHDKNEAYFLCQSDNVNTNVIEISSY
jgi:hypothetical protein